MNVFDKLVVLVAVPLLATAAAAAEKPKPDPARVQRGSQLAAICHDCHTPKKMGAHGPELDPAMLLAGHRESPVVPPPPALPPGPWGIVGSMELTAWSGPWGVSYAPNLTPDADTGLGIWTEDMFISAIRTGKHMGQSRPILPPMPWQAISQHSDEDLKAIFAYLRSVPPVKNRVPDPRIAEPPAPSAK